MAIGVLPNGAPMNLTDDPSRMEPRFVIENIEGVKVDASNTFDPCDPRFVRVSDEPFAGAKTFYEPKTENGQTVGYFVRFVEVNELVMPEDHITSKPQPERVAHYQTYEEIKPISLDLKTQFHGGEIRTYSSIIQYESRSEMLKTFKSLDPQTVDRVRAQLLKAK